MNFFRSLQETVKKKLVNTNLNVKEKPFQKQNKKSFKTETVKGKGVNWKKMKIWKSRGSSLNIFVNLARSPLTPQGRCLKILWSLISTYNHYQALDLKVSCAWCETTQYFTNYPALLWTWFKTAPDFIWNSSLTSCSLSAANSPITLIAGKMPIKTTTSLWKARKAFATISI